jgi:hypothetical protein
VSLHRLDPRSEGEPDVRIFGKGPEACDKLPNYLAVVGSREYGGATEAEALAAARRAAGLGHVALAPCARFVHEPDTGPCTHGDDDCGDCFECAWPWNRHPERSTGETR